jgi:hypothetical protein
LERLRSRPYTYAQVAQLAAQAAQVAVAQKKNFFFFFLNWFSPFFSIGVFNNYLGECIC